MQSGSRRGSAGGGVACGGDQRRRDGGHEGDDIAHLGQRFPVVGHPLEQIDEQRRLHHPGEVAVVGEPDVLLAPAEKTGSTSC